MAKATPRALEGAHILIALRYKLHFAIPTSYSRVFQGSEYSIFMENAS
jgi:hypothetical protein